MLASNISKPVASSSSNTNYGGKKPLPSSSCWVWEGWWGTLCSLTLNQQDERYWSSHDTALLGQETTSGLFPGFSWVPISTESAVALLHQDDHGFPGMYKMVKQTLPDWLHVLFMSGSNHNIPCPAQSKWSDAQLFEKWKITLEVSATSSRFCLSLQALLQYDEHVLRCLLPHIQGGQTSTHCQIPPELLFFCSQLSNEVNILRTTISGLFFWSCWAPTSPRDITYRFSLLSFFPKSFRSFFYYVTSSLVCTNSWVLTCVLHYREHSPVTLQTQSMPDQNACNNTDFPWLQLMSQQSSSWDIWQRHCSVKKTFHNLGTINSPITYAATSFCFVYKTFNTRVSAFLWFFIFLIISRY